MNSSLIYRLLFGHLLFLLYWLSESKSIDSITSEDIEAALERALKKVNAQEELKRDLVAKGKVLDPSIYLPEATHQLKGKNLGGYNIDNPAREILEAATQDLVSRFGLSKDDIKKLSKIPLDGEIGRQVTLQCLDERETNCDPNSKFRTIDGSCNNLGRPNEGRIFSCHNRIVENDYDDRVSLPRTKGNTLPNARDVSRSIHRVISGEDGWDPFLSTAFMSFGQFVVHDLLFTSQPQTVNNTLISCCPLSANSHQECFPILLRNDPDFDRDCMNFVRNARCPQCSLNVREQINEKTPFQDCSQVYGTTDIEAASLRSRNGDGKLASRIISGVGEMPLANNNTGIVPCGSPDVPCFLLGDFRANQNLLLLLHHICWFRLHNRIVDLLKKINPHWDGERLYQEARRIVIAYAQHITFFEYLPKLIGVKLMQSYNLDYLNTQYDARESPALINSFVVAPFRFGHSTVPNTFWAVTENNQYREIPLRDSFFFPLLMYQENGVQDLARGSFLQCQKSLNRLVDRSVTEFLYVRQNGTPGLDLAAINIQRGRDHGVPGYTTYVRHMCGVQIREFRDLIEKGFLYRECVDRLESIYRSVHDIDLWTGIICEEKMTGALLGRVGGHIVAEQFYRLKYSDRFFYTHMGQAGSFSSAQKYSIYDITLGRIFCDIFDLTEVAEYPLECWKEITSCNNYRWLPAIDLSAWKE